MQVLCTVVVGAERASTGQRCARGTARKKRAVSVTRANPKARTAPGSGSGRRMHGSTKNACGTTRQTIRPGSAKSAKPGSEKMPLPQCTHAPSALSIACAGRAKYRSGVTNAARPSRQVRSGRPRGTTHHADRRLCRDCASQVKPCFRCRVAKAEAAFGVTAWKARRADRRVCKACAVKGQGTWRSAGCTERKPRVDFSNACVRGAAKRAAAQRANNSLARPRRRLARADARVYSCHGPQLLRSVSQRAIRRLAATRTKVAEEKRKQIIGLVREEIANRVRKKQDAHEVLAPRAQEPNRSKESQMAQSKTAPEAQRLSTNSVPSRKRRLEPQRDQQGQLTPTKTQPRTQTTQVAQAEPAAKRAKHVSVSSHVCTDHKQKREQGSDKGLAPSETQTGTNAKARTAPSPRGNVQAKPQQETQATPTPAQTTNAPPAKLAGQTAAEEMFQYACPFCAVSVTSTVRTGQVDHRRACGKFFRVKDGHVAAKNLVYACPFCDGTVGNVRTGRIDHRLVCGNQFYVKEGTVSALTRQHPHTCPACQTVVWSSQLFGRVRCQHNTPAGKPCPKNTWQVQERKHETKK